MKFADLTINQSFTVKEYPECTCTKTKTFGGSCCTPPHNAKMVCFVGGVAQEKMVMFEANQEVELIEENFSMSSEPENPEDILVPQPKREQPKPKSKPIKDNRVGYKWVGPGEDPTRKMGGNFGD